MNPDFLALAFQVAAKLHAKQCTYTRTAKPPVQIIILWPGKFDTLAHALSQPHQTGPPSRPERPPLIAKSLLGPSRRPALAHVVRLDKPLK